MIWILIAIFSYFLLAITALGDDYLLAGPPEPKSYTFFINAPGILLLLLMCMCMFCPLFFALTFNGTPFRFQLTTGRAV